MGEGDLAVEEPLEEILFGGGESGALGVEEEPRGEPLEEGQGGKLGAEEAAEGGKPRLRFGLVPEGHQLGFEGGEGTQVRGLEGPLFDPLAGGSVELVQLLLPREAEELAGERVGVESVLGEGEEVGVDLKGRVGVEESPLQRVEPEGYGAQGELGAVGRIEKVDGGKVGAEERGDLVLLAVEALDEADRFGRVEGSDRLEGQGADKRGRVGVSIHEFGLGGLRAEEEPREASVKARIRGRRETLPITLGEDPKEMNLVKFPQTGFSNLFYQKGERVYAYCEN